MYQVQDKRQGVVLSEGMWIRFSLDWVTRTGENLRDLGMLGLFRFLRKNDGSLMSCFVEDP